MNCLTNFFFVAALFFHLPCLLSEKQMKNKRQGASLFLLLFLGGWEIDVAAKS
ncbi:MAG: hypothetical protein ACON5H_05975 [Akkermansiaceae bacterium]